MYSRLCRLMCGRPLAFRNTTSMSETVTVTGKAEPFRTSGRQSRGPTQPPNQHSVRDTQQSSSRITSRRDLGQVRVEELNGRKPLARVETISQLRLLLFPA